MSKENSKELELLLRLSQGNGLLEQAFQAEPEMMTAILRRVLTDLRERDNGSLKRGAEEVRSIFYGLVDPEPDPHVLVDSARTCLLQWSDQVTEDGFFRTERKYDWSIENLAVLYVGIVGDVINRTEQRRTDAALAALVALKKRSLHGYGYYDSFKRMGKKNMKATIEYLLEQAATQKHNNIMQGAQS